MKTKRPISINNSLVHGICNCNCITCGVNKSTYNGPKEYQPETITMKIIDRVEEAALSGIYINNIDNSGDGEPTLHPRFTERMDMFGELKNHWKLKKIKAPKISVVTNGLNLNKPGIIESIIKNRINLKISFPTNNYKHYNEIMFSNPELTKEKFTTVVNNIGIVMNYVKQGKIPDLEFHISPPFLKYVKSDFPQTIEFLRNKAREAGLRKIRLAMFPAPTNRTGLVTKKWDGIEFYKSLFKENHGRKIEGVIIDMFLSYKHFYPHFDSFLDVLRAYMYPCLWYGANMFITSTGESICCNDQAILDPQGNIMDYTIEQLVEFKEKKRPFLACAKCNQTPEHMISYDFFKRFHHLVNLKTKFNLKRYEAKKRLR